MHSIPVNLMSQFYSPSPFDFLNPENVLKAQKYILASLSSIIN